MLIYWSLKGNYTNLHNKACLQVLGSTAAYVNKVT